VQQASTVPPIWRLPLVRIRIFSVANIIAFVNVIAMLGALAFLPQYLSSGRPESPLRDHL
jgi:hypothetical protein